MIVNTDTPPPPSELATSIVGAGAAEDSDPARSVGSTVPSRSAGPGRCTSWRTPAGPGTETASPPGRRPPAGPRDLRDHGAVSRPGLLLLHAPPWRRRHERIDPKPAGTVITIVLVVRPLFSVGTARLYGCDCPDTDTAGLIRACADAIAGSHNPAPPASTPRQPQRVPGGTRDTKVVLLVLVIRTAPTTRRALRSPRRTAAGPAVRQRRERRQQHIEPPAQDNGRPAGEDHSSRGALINRLEHAPGAVEHGREHEGNGERRRDRPPAAIAEDAREAARVAHREQALEELLGGVDRDQAGGT